MGKKQKSIKITNFSRKDKFFIETPKFNSYMNEVKNKNVLQPNKSEIGSLTKLIGDYEKEISKIEKEQNKKSIILKPEFEYGLRLFKKIEDINTEYGKRVGNILEALKNDKIKISLKNIQKKYFEIYNEKKSLMTFSRILRYKLNYHFIKTTVKNPKLKKKLYKFMAHFFIKGIVRSIKLGLKLIFIDETGFQLSNNNYYCWRKYENEIFGGASIKLKDRINLILAVDDQKIIHYKILNKTVKQKDFIEFLEDLNTKLCEKEKKNYILIIDNAKCHLTEEVKSVVLKNDLKLITNCPYLSKFNGVEYVFRTIKAEIYRDLLKNQKKLKGKIINILQDIKIRKTLVKIYLKELKEYKKFIDENGKEDLNEL